MYFDISNLNQEIIWGCKNYYINTIKLIKFLTTKYRGINIHFKMYESGYKLIEEKLPQHLSKTITPYCYITITKSLLLDNKNFYYLWLKIKTLIINEEVFEALIETDFMIPHVE